jgi:cytochrome c biogenesis protein
LSHPESATAGGRRILLFLASSRWMIAFFIGAALAALAVAYDFAPATTVMVVPLGLLAINLIAAIAVRPALRADGALLLLHLALLVLLCLFVVARLTYMDSAVSLTNGVPFDGQLLRDERGPLHRDQLAELRFENAGYTENFPHRGSYEATYNRVRWWDAAGRVNEAVIGDDRPLILAGYRIYTSKFRGFSPVFHWQAIDGREEIASVQLNDTRMGDFAQASEWQIPGGPRVWAKIELLDPTEPGPGARRVDLGVEQLNQQLVVRSGNDRHVMKLGDALDLPGGRLTYLRLDSWLGYRIIYDPTQPWLLASVMTAVVSLVWFYARRLRAPRHDD